MQHFLHIVAGFAVQLILNTSVSGEVSPRGERRRADVLVMLVSR